MKYEFKEAKEVPVIWRERGYQWRELVLQFKSSGLPSSEITKYKPAETKIVSFQQALMYAIRKEALQSEIFLIRRKDRIFIINIKLSGLKYTKPNRRKSEKLPTWILNRRIRQKERRQNNK